MFGHDDTDKDTNIAAPEHDGVLGSTPTAPAVDDTPTDDTSSPAYIVSKPHTDEAPAPTEELLTATTASGNDLIDIKQSALKMLTPLVGHLNQSPEEKFRTTMMMIQASDDQSLIKDAYAAAQAIPDEKTKAQALLDIINEINYFTQQS